MTNALRFTCLFTLLTALGCAGPSAQAPAPEPDAAAAAQTAEAASVEAAVDAPGVIHTVFFWLRDDLTDEERSAFVEGNRSLTEIPSVRRLYFGPPAPTEARPVVDQSYDYALILHFDDLAGQNAYQVDPLHLQMLEDHGDKWTRVLVYDSEVMD